MPAEFATKIPSIGKARQILGSRQTVQLDIATALTYIDHDTVEMRHYGTTIVTFRSDGSVEVDPQGYLTSTTMRRVRMVLPDRFKLNVVKGAMVLTDQVRREKHEVGQAFRFVESYMERVLA